MTPDSSSAVRASGPQAATPQLSSLARVVALGLYTLVALAIVLPLGRYVLVPLVASGAPAAGWSWSSVLATLALSIAALALFGWGLHRLVNTQLDDDGLRVPGWRGRKLVRWAEIRRVSGRGLQIKLHTATSTVTVNPLCYARPGEVVPFLLRKVPIPVAGGHA